MASEDKHVLRYAFGNEDYRTEHQALNIQPDDRIFSVTGSGERTLHLLLKDCREVVSIDPNEFQTQLLALKCASLNYLSYENYLGFLGAKPSSVPRFDLWNGFKNQLEKDSQLFWDTKKRMISKGILYEGKLEKWCYKLSRFIHLKQSKKISQLLSLQTSEEQKKFIEKEWSSNFWETSAKEILHPYLLRLIFKQFNLYQQLLPSRNTSAYIGWRIQTGFLEHSIKNNSLLSLILTGKVAEEAWPPYLKAKGVKLIKSRLHKLQIQTAEIPQFLEEQRRNSFDAFSLSDPATYVDQEEFRRLLKAILHTARPGARFCFRTFLINYSIPHELNAYFRRDVNLEKQLQKQDRSLVFQFCAGTIGKPLI